MMTSEHLAALNRVLPMLRRAYWTDGSATLPLAVLTDAEMAILPDLAAMGCLRDGGDGLLYDIVPWNEIERLILRLAEQDETLERASLRPLLNALPLNLDEADKLLLLSSLGLVERREDGAAGIRSRYEREMDTALSFIEERDALQVRYGIFEPFLTIRDFVLDYPLPRDPLYVTQRLILWRLYQEQHILMLQTGEDPRLWQIRSRTAEIVRLLAQLRKRQAANSKSHLDPSLVRDVRWEMRRRTVPERSIPFERMLVDVVNDTIDPQHTPWDDSIWQSAQRAYLDALASRYPMISQFQARSMRRIFGMLRQPSASPRGVVITTATGSGKTLAFAAPMLLQAVLERAVGQRPGVKAICIYPRQKLAENQLAEFVRLLHRLNHSLRHLGLPGLTVGIDYQGTPHGLDDFKPPAKPQDGLVMKDAYGQRLSRFWTWLANAEGWRCPYASCPACDGPLVFRQRQAEVWLACAKCGERVDFILPTKTIQRQSPPDLLIITTETLNRRLGEPASQSLFGSEMFTIPSLVVLDEIHLHTGVNGAQVALLIRRLLQRLRLAAETLGRHEAPVVVGLSATIREPKAHMERLTGLPLSAIHHEQVDPHTDKVQQVGADHYVFIRPDRQEAQPLSCLARASQCLAHNMRQPEGGGEAYKILGFVDSLDIVGRWRRLMSDIERNQHFALRDPEQIRRSPPLQTYGPNRIADCTECFQRPASPDPKCTLFQIGECWWFMRKGGHLSPLRIQSARSGMPMPAEYDMTVATSVLEVGYDDADIMAIIQYQAPRNVASFVQRKGRGGRSPSDRPISLTVINPGHANDVHLYRNAHVLTDPLFTKLPLNVENEEVLKAHGILSFFDYAAFLLRDKPRSSSPWNAAHDVLRHYQRLLRSEWTVFERTHLSPLVGDNRRVIDRVRTRVRDFVEMLERTGKARLLPDLAHELPRNLFSSINLPEVDVLDADSQDSPYVMEKLAIDQAMRELSPGRVTYRFAKQRYQAYWLPPVVSEECTGCGQCSVASLYKVREENVPSIDWRLVPRSLASLRLGPQDDGGSTLLPVYRPLAALLRRFAHDTAEHFVWANWFCCERCQSFFKRSELKAHSGHSPAQLGDGSGGSPIGFLQVSADRRLLNPDTVFYEGNDSFAKGYWFGPYAGLFASLAFFNKNAGEYMQVLKVSLGSEVWAIFQDRASKSWTFTYALNGQGVALGYSMHTEGVVLTLADTEFLSPDELPADLRQRLRLAAFCFDILSACRGPQAPRLLPTSALVEAMAIWYDEMGCAEFGHQIREERATLRKNIQALLNRLTERFPRRHHANILEPLDNDPFWLGVVIPAFERRLERPDYDTERLFVNDVLFHSLKHILRDAVSTELGAESGFNLAGWWHTGQDFPNMGDRREMMLFEYGMHGIGYMRDWFNRFPTSPQAVWNALEERMGHCPTGDEEGFLRAVLALPVERLEELADLVAAIREAASFHDRQAAVAELDATMRDEYGLELSESLRRLLVRLFGEPLSLESGEVIANWRLYRELDVCLSETLASMSHRPSLEELEGRAYRLLKTKPEQMPTWYQLQSSLEKNLTADQVEKRVRSEMGKRFLTTCIDGCPDCLHGPCELESAPERSTLLLSRQVLALAMEKLRRPTTITLGQQPDEVVLARLHHCLAQHCIAYLVYTRADAERVPVLVSSLLAQPVIHRGRRFGVSVNGSTYERISLVDHNTAYRLSLRCYPLEALDAQDS